MQEMTIRDAVAALNKLLEWSDDQVAANLELRGSEELRRLVAVAVSPAWLEQDFDVEQLRIERDEARGKLLDAGDEVERLKLEVRKLEAIMERRRRVSRNWSEATVALARVVAEARLEPVEEVPE